MKLNRTGSRWDRTQRININDNWDTLEKENIRLSDIGKQAENTLKEAFDINSEAKRVNDENENVQQQIDNLILADGESDAEVLQARGPFDLLNNRLNSIDEKIQQISVNVKDFGAIGDGESHPLSERFQYLSEAQAVYPQARSLVNEIDRCAIEAAIAFVSQQNIGSKQGGRVYMPPGTYVTDQRIDLDDNMTLEGAGQYVTTFFPNYYGANAFADLIRVNGTETERKKNVTVRGFGIDGSNLEFYVKTEGEPAFEAGQWARITPRYVDNFVAEDIYGYHGSHIFQMLGCHNFLVRNIRGDYMFNCVHMTGGLNKGGIINNVTGTRVATAVDFGGGNEEVIVNNVWADNEGYIRNDQEVIDVGGAKNVQISNVYAKNFAFGVTVKGEGKKWDNVKFSNCVFRDFTGFGIRATRGDTAENIGHLSMDNCTFASSVMDGTGDAISLVGGYLDLKNVKVDVNGGGLHAYSFKEFKGKGLDIKTDGRSLHFSRNGNLMNENWHLEDVTLESANGRACEISSNSGNNFINNLKILKSADTALTFDGVRNPHLHNSVIQNVDNHAVRLVFDNASVANLNDMNGLNVDFANVTIRDWGQGSAWRNGLYFSVPTVTGSFKNMRLKNMSFEITGTQNTQSGVAWGAFGDNAIDYSQFDITFYRVPSEESNADYRGLNNIENIMSIK